MVMAVEESWGEGWVFCFICVPAGPRQGIPVWVSGWDHEEEASPRACCQADSVG